MKNQIESIKAKLRNISKESNKAHQLTLTRYFQERFLFRLSKSKYREHFFLKGGVLIYALEGQPSRPTLDLDLLGRKIEADTEKVRNIFKEICEIKYKKDGIAFDSSSIETSEIVKEGNYPGIRVKVMVRLDNIRQRMQIDIGFGDVIVPGPVPMIYPTLIEMDKPELFAYSIESLIAEKFEAMIDLADLNSRMKDFYDVYRLLSTSKCDEIILEEAIAATFAKRNTELSKNHVLFSEAFAQNEKRKKQWKAFLKKAKLNEHLDFFEVMAAIKEKLKPIYEKAQIK